MGESRKKVLLVGPHYTDPGGVVSYIKAIRPCIESEYDVTYLPIGSYGIRYLSLILDQIRLPLALLRRRYDLVYINPSFNMKSYLRDGAFIAVANLFRRKTLVFVHGWERPLEKKINGPLRLLFNLSFRKATSIIVLSPVFKSVLEKWGCQNVYVDTTIVPDNYAQEKEVTKKLEDVKQRKGLSVLFMSRLAEEKGALETVHACQQLIREGLEIRLSIAGDGPAMSALKEAVSNDEESAPRIRLLGDVRGQEKLDLLVGHDCFCLPTYCWEGFPIALVEAMTFGMPLITCPSGGIKVHFKAPEMGFLVPGQEVEPLAAAIKTLYEDKELCVEIGNFNRAYAVQHHSASSTFDRISHIYKQTIES
jgi:glycosyltransferase involved in cell wall biosynthesis